jgi:hypothetical protein
VVCTWRRKGEYDTLLAVARKPDLRNKDEVVLSPADLKQMREGLSRLSIEAVRHAYQTAYARCRMVNDRVPSARSMQELVQAWKQLWVWRR